MFDAAEMNELAARKRLLAAESELNRQTLRLEFSRMRASVAGVTDLVQSGRSVWRVLAVAAPLAGLLGSRKNGRWRALARAVLAGWQVFKRIQPIWTAFRAGLQTGQKRHPPASAEPGAPDTGHSAS